MRPRIVLVDAANTQGAVYGAQKVILAQVERLRERAEFVAAIPWSAGPFVDALVQLEVPVHALPLRDSLDAGRTALAALLSGGGLVHTHDLRASAVARPVAQTAGWPVVTTYHENLLLPGLSLRARLKRWLVVQAERRTASLTRQSIAVSRSIADEVVGRLGLSAERVQVVHNGVAEATVDDAAVTAACQVCALAPDDRPVVLLGQLVPRKGQHLLLQAAPAILAAEPRAVFVCVGDGPARADLLAQAESAGVADRCRFVGYYTPSAPFLALAEVVVLPSLAEGLPMVALEAMALARPLVASRAGGTGELVEDGVSGRLVPVGDVTALAAGVGELLSDGGLSQRLGAAAQRRVREEFSLEANAERTWAVYERVLGGASS